MISKRDFGRTGHKSSAAIFGGFALSNVTLEEAGMEPLWPGGIEGGE